MRPRSDYKRFTTTLYRARQGQVVDIRRYDFDFWAWPVDFYWNEGPRGDPRTDVPLKRIFPAEPEGGRTFLGKIIGAPWSFMCYAMANTVGYRLLYPGTLGFIQTALHNALLQGRAKLVEERGGIYLFIIRLKSGHGRKERHMAVCEFSYKY